MTARHDHSNHEGILFPRVIECPVCGERAHSFRIRRVTDLRTVDGEFYHRTATCAGSMTLDMAAAMDLLRLAPEEVASRLELPVQIEWPSDSAASYRREVPDTRSGMLNERNLNWTKSDLPSPGLSEEPCLA
jgi:hypothetical protein